MFLLGRATACATPAAHFLPLPGNLSIPSLRQVLPASCRIVRNTTTMPAAPHGGGTQGARPRTSGNRPARLKTMERLGPNHSDQLLERSGRLKGLTDLNGVRYFNDSVTVTIQTQAGPRITAKADPPSARAQVYFLCTSHAMYSITAVLPTGYINHSRYTIHRFHINQDERKFEKPLMVSLSNH